MSHQSADRILVPVGDSVTLRNTVAYVVRKLLDRDDVGERPTLYFAYPVSWQRRDLETDVGATERELLDRVEAWVREDAGVADEEPLPFDVRTELIGTDQYLFSPTDYAEVLLAYAREHDIGHIVLDPEYRPGPSAPILDPLTTELDRAETVTYEEAPIDRQIRGRRVLGRQFDLGNLLATFGVSFLFYVVIGGFAGTFDYATGAVSAAIVAVVLSGVTFEGSVQPTRTAVVLARWVVYLPLLLWEIAKANLQVAYIVLLPSMPIDPSVERFTPAVPRGLPGTTLANSITLTPGTVTIDVREREFLVHALTEDAREGLYGGRLERAVRFVFFGRQSTNIPSPRDRGQAEEDKE